MNPALRTFLLTLLFSASASPTQPAQASLGRVFPGALGLLSLPGCAEMKSAGDECPEVDFEPAATGRTSRTRFEEIHAVCRLGELSGWDQAFAGPVLPDDCKEAILDLLPLDTAFRTGTTGPVVQARSNLVRAFHALLYFPLADTGDTFGSEDAADYCPKIYGDFLGANHSTQIPTAPFHEESVNPGANFDRLNLQLARFFLERTDAIHFVRGNGTWYAREQDGDIEISEDFALLDMPLSMAAVLVHETRHNATGFPDGSDHVECLQGQSAGSADCDDFMFGSYGAHISYLDAALKGSLLTSLWDGTPLLDELQAKSVVSTACVLYQEAINYKDGRLSDLFEGEDCGLLSSDLDSFFEQTYGIPAGTMVFR